MEITKFKVTLLGFCCLFCTSILAQTSRSQKHVIGATVSLNINPQLRPFTWYNEGFVEREPLDLEFLTDTSGIFELEKIRYWQENDITVQVPTSLISLGAGFYILNKKSIFHELTVYSLSKVKYTEHWQALQYYGSGDPRRVDRGVHVVSFSVAGRYVMGKLFGDPRWSTVRFGLSGGVSYLYSRMKRDEYTSINIPIEANISTIKLSLVPILDIKLTDRLYTNLKVIPNYYIGGFGKVTIKNPLLLARDQSFERATSKLIDMGFSAAFRYVLVIPRKRRR